jgi:hypothetical protein
MQFEIVPFVPCPGVTKLSGNVSRTNNQLSVEFLPMVLTDILWPARDSQPKRLDNLWQFTCFECFVGTNREASYLEINASPEGHWQAYHLSDYRTNLQPSKDTHVTVRTKSSAQALSSIGMRVDISDPAFVTEDWQISVSAVLKSKSGVLHFFAATHPHDRPDFHLAELRDFHLPAINLEAGHET